MAQKIEKGIDNLLPELKGRKVFLVRGNISRYPKIKEFFEPITVQEFSNITPNPLYEQAVDGVKKFNASGCDTIVAVGGGSIIDVAKCIKLYCRMDPTQNYLKQEKKDTGILLIAIPTTAGTGSESTRHAVLYYEGEKQSISHESIVPDIAVLEPSVLESLPVYQKKSTMLDALCQAIESWWSVNSNDESKGYSKIAVEMIRDNWKAYIEDNSLEAAAKIMEAANYAGRAINITATTAAHAMSYKLSSMYKIPHGHAVSVCMTQVWGYMLKHTEKCIDSRGKEYLECVFNEIPVSYDWFMDLMQKLEMTYPVSDNREADIEKLATSVNPVRLKNNPVELDSDTLKSMYERIVK